MREAGFLYRGIGRGYNHSTPKNRSAFRCELCEFHAVLGSQEFAAGFGCLSRRM